MKVGKAIYNILSQSTDVQSNFPFNTTDYAPTGTELVTNGDFSAGVEQILDGDFPLPNVNWTLGTGWSILSNEAIFSGTAHAQLKPTITVLEVGKSYKLTFDATVDEGSFKVQSGTDLITSSEGGSFEKYFVCTNITISWARASVGVQNDFTISNVSIKELGEGWTISGDDRAAGYYIDYIAAGAQFVSPTVSPIMELKQNGLLSNGVTYKFTCNTAYTGAGKLKVALSGVNYDLDTEGLNTIYFTAGVGANLSILRTSFPVDCIISNVSLEAMALTKIFPELAPPDIDAPYIVYSVVSNSPSETKNTNGDIDVASIEVYGFQDTYNKAVDLGVSVRAALDRKTGTYNTIEIQSTNYVNEQMDVNEARKLWAAIQDYSIRIKNI